VLNSNVTVLARHRSPHAATFEAEIVTCRWADGSERQLFCKVGVRHPNNQGDDHGSVAYEGRVYEKVLVPHGWSPVRFFGARLDEASGATSLLLEYLGDAVTVDRAPARIVALTQAAGWIGRFHQAAARLIDDPECEFLVRYTADDYVGWADRALAFARQRDMAPSWLEPVCRGFRRFVDVLVARPVTIIHGDYYADNALVHLDEVRPIDWGWAAVAPGEFDLASLTDGWPEEVEGEAIRTYRENRWSSEEPDFHDAMIAARFYELFRGLGRRPESVGSSRWNRRLKRLRQCAVSAGVVE
jgi:hypothetical protein